MQEPFFLTEDAGDKAAFRHLMERAAGAITAAVGDGSAYAGPAPQQLAGRVGAYDVLPPQGLGFEAVMQDVERDILPNFLRTGSAQYMAHLHSPPLMESVASELILSAFNQSMDSWDQSPVATETELAVVRFLCGLFGYGTGSDGCFTSGGSQSNLTALLMARDWFCATALGHDVKKRGLPAEYARLRLYTSAASHFSMEKSCHLLGLGYDCVVKVPVDGRQKMDAECLGHLVAQDRAAGNLPFCVVATIGTTDYGSIDDVAALSRVAAQNGMWLHADAAYGSALVMSEQYRGRMGDLSVCDSVTVDFHKMFLLPVSCSAVLAKRAASFDPMQLHADYLNREEDEEDGYTNLVGKSLQTTRRFDALKVWMAFRARGRDGYDAIVSTCVQNARYAYDALCRRDRFEPAIEPEISSVVFRVVPACGGDSDLLNKKVRRDLLHGHGIVIGQTVHKGRVHLKFTMLNPRLDPERIDALLDTIEQLARVACHRVDNR